MEIIITDDRKNDFVITKSIVKKALPGLPADVLRTFKVPGQMNNGILEYIYRNYSKKGDRVLDPMCSVGTAVYYAAKLGRYVQGFELIKNLVDIGTYLIHELVPWNKLWKISPGNIFECELPHDCFDLAIFSPPQLMIKRGPYPSHKDQMGNFDLHNEDAYFDKISFILHKLKKALHIHGKLVTLNVNMKRLDESVYLFPDAMNRTIETAGFSLVDEVIVQRLHHKNIDGITYEYLRTYQS